MTNPPASIVAGSGLDVTILAEDAYGNVDLNFAGAITLSLSGNPAQAGISGMTSATASAGVATFNGVMIDGPANTNYLQAASDNLQPATTRHIQGHAGSGHQAGVRGRAASQRPGRP